MLPPYRISSSGTAASGDASTAPHFSFYEPIPSSGWGPNDISTVVFGCIASILGGFTLLITLMIACKASKSRIGDAERDGVSYDGAGAMRHDDIPLTPIESHEEEENAAERVQSPVGNHMVGESS